MEARTSKQGQWLRAQGHQTRTDHGKYTENKTGVQMLFFSGWVLSLSYMAYSLNKVYGSIS
jgi:hypothetical protein